MEGLDRTADAETGAFLVGQLRDDALTNYRRARRWMLFSAVLILAALGALGWSFYEQHLPQAWNAVLGVFAAGVALGLVIGGFCMARLALAINSLSLALYTHRDNMLTMHDATSSALKFANTRLNDLEVAAGMRRVEREGGDA